MALEWIEEEMESEGEQRGVGGLEHTERSTRNEEVLEARGKKPYI